MIFFQKWLIKRIEKKREKQAERDSLIGWARLYETLNNTHVDCRNCDSLKDCYNKHNRNVKKLPHITKDQLGCKNFKHTSVPTTSPIRGVSGVSGYTGVSGVSGYVKHQGQYPPWNRGVNSCNHQCQQCSAFTNGVCTKP